MSDEECERQSLYTLDVPNYTEAITCYGHMVQSVQRKIIARLSMDVNRTYYSEKFRDRLQMDTLTGSLTINDCGLNKLHIISEEISFQSFNLNVYSECVFTSVCPVCRCIFLMCRCT